MEDRKRTIDNGKDARYRAGRILGGVERRDGQNGRRKLS